MLNIKKLNNPAETTVGNFMQATNAYIENQNKAGVETTKYLSAENAKKAYGGVLKLITNFVNRASGQHNVAYNALKDEVNADREILNNLEALGQKVLNNVSTLAQTYSAKNGLEGEAAIEAAFNSLMGNPVYDHFGNINLLAGQLYQNKAIIDSFISKGDAFSVPTEAGGSNNAISRFRIPVERVSGSAKKYQGDINPQGIVQNDANRIQHSLFNEFKNADTLEAAFSITKDQRDQALGYQRAVQPALAGFILQNRYFQSTQEHVMKLAEVLSVDGTDAAGSYTPNVGGSYGLLSPAIQLQLASYNAASALPATGADWLANPTKLIQKIQNFYAKPASVTAPLPASLGTTLLYQDIVRLFTLAALSNVEYASNGQWTLYVPTSWYAMAVQYPSSGTFNKQLVEMVKAAVGDSIIKSIEILPSSLMDYRASNTYGVAQYNCMMAVAHGAENEKKPVILPGQTAVPTVVSTENSAQAMNFITQYQFGGPTVVQYGGAFILEFSLTA